MPQNRRVSQLALWSILIALAVMGIKFAAWQYSGSVALYSDALESIVNVIAAIIAWLAIRLSHKPADRHHQYGHHKAEYFSAVIEGVLIALAALLIFYEAYHALIDRHELESPGLGMAVNAVATAINGFWAWLLITNGKRYRSPALEADGRHIFADVITSLGVLAGLVVVMFTGWVVLDAIMAILVGLNVLREGWHLVYSSVNGLMDVSADSEEFELIEKTIVANAKGAIEAHDIKTRVSGPVSFVEFHLVVDGNMSVADSHIICDRIETALMDAIPGVQTTIHVEPDPETKDTGLKVS